MTTGVLGYVAVIITNQTHKNVSTGTVKDGD